MAIRLTGFYTVGDPITVNPEELTFTGGAAGNWATAQEVTVAGVADDDEFDNIAEIEHNLTIGDDFGYMPDVNVTVADGNRAPYFEEGILTVRSVPENSAASTDVGSPVTALDLNTGDTLAYTLEDDPDSEFEINSSTGQITVAAGAILDHEASPPVVRLVKVTVSDRTTGGLTDSIAVDIMVADVNEPPEIAGEASPSIDENASVATRVAGYTAADPERGSITWSVEDTAGNPSDDFEIDTSGNLRFQSSPDHEAEDEYSIVIVATDDGDPAQSGELPVTVTVADVNEPPEITGDEALSFPENTATTTVLETYDASDPEGAASTFTWSLSGTDRGDFDIDSSTGALRFKSVPDYERPADSGGNNVYNVQVRASDNGTPALTGTLDITVTVTNVNEAPSTPTGRNAITVAENSSGNLARYSATDPDRGDTVTWGVSGTDASAFRIDSSGNLAFDGAPDYDSPADSGGDNVYNVKVDAKDESLTSSYDVAVTVTPVDEPPVVTGASTINNYDENGTGSVATYTASDPEGDTDIDWSLGGPDRGDFTITGGVLAFANPPDYDRPADSGGDNQYEVTIYATDSNNKRGELQADVIVRNVDEAPVLTGPATVDDFPENSATSRQLGRYTATDPEGATITLSLSGTDSDKFALASNGALTFRESPDYEDQDSYSVTVRAVAGSHTVDTAVTVNIENIEERGTVTLSAVQPQERTALTATLADDDGPSGTTWQWYRTSSRGSAGTAITTATSPAYTPAPEDVGRYLRVVATYDDPHGNDKTAAAVSANLTLAFNPDNLRPVFPSNTADRSIRENTRAGTSLGAAVRATDANNDRLTYSIPASDDFEIVSATGQLRTRRMLDHEDQDTHTITVTATDPGDLPATITVTITVEDVDEVPVVSGPDSPSVAENGGSTVATYTATDPDGTGIEWALTGSDSGAFTLSGGILTLNEVADYEEKTRYRVTVEAREQGGGTSVGSLRVTVNVTNVDEPGMIEIDVSEPRVGQRLSPTVEDPDGGVGSIEWKWERRASGGAWTSIPRATSQSYTPTRDDNGHDLRVVAIYRDREGSGKTETHEFPSAVVLRPFFDADREERTIQENSPEGRNVGGRFAARHPDNVNLAYTLGGSDSVHFTVDPATGQMRTSIIPLDYETLNGHQAEVQITATAPDSETATITVTVTVTNECTTAGEPPCAPGRPGVSSASDTSLRVTWSTPRTPSGTTITGYDLQYRESDSGASWIPQGVAGTDRSQTIENLVKDTTYEVQVRARNSKGDGEWSQSSTGTPGVARPAAQPQPQPQPQPQQPAGGSGGGGSGGGGGGGSVGGGGFGGGGGFVPPAVAAPPRPASDFQRVAQVFQPLSGAGTLGRVWRLIESSQRWLFYDPRPDFTPFNTLRTINLASDPPAVAIMSVTRNQQFRGMPLYPGWNFVPVTAVSLAPQPARGTQPVSQWFRPLATSGVLQRVWWLDSRTQVWKFYDPDPNFTAFNTLTTIDLAANPPVVLAVGVSRQTEFRGRTLYPGWNYVVMR